MQLVPPCHQRALVRVTAIAAVFLVAACASPPEGRHRDLAYLSVGELEERMERGELTAVELVAFFERRIAEIDRNGPTLRAILELNPEARSIAERLDRERRESGPRGPLHGIPVVLKANIDTGDEMATSAGSIALADHRAPDDALHVAALREAGVVILAKANLSEWANFRSTRSSSGWSGLGGQTRNPYVLDRNPCGSSSGSAVAVAAGLAPLAVGSETDGSIVCPAGVNGIVGIKPTVGLVSRDGIVPIARTQDTAGPMARSVRDAALLLGAMAVPDPDEPAAVEHPGRRGYAAALAGDALRGATLGVWRGYPGAGRSPRIEARLDEVVALLERLGATVVDPVDLEIPEAAGDGEWEVLKYEFKSDLDRYLSEAGVDPEIDTLAELVAFNREHAEVSMPWFGQEIFELSEAMGPLTEPAYSEALAASRDTVRRAIDQAMEDAALDAIIAPTNGPAWVTDWVHGDRYSVGSSMPAAVAGYPAITLPMGQIHGLPIGVTLFGRPWSEPELIGYAFALEQRLGAWSAPEFRTVPEPDRGSPANSD